MTTDELDRYLNDAKLLPRATVRRPKQPKPVVKPVQTVAEQHEEKRKKFIDTLISEVEKSKKQFDINNGLLKQIDDQLVTVATRLFKGGDKSLEREQDRLYEQRDKVADENIRLKISIDKSTENLFLSINPENVKQRKIDMMDGNRVNQVWEIAKQHFDRFISDRYKLPAKIDTYYATAAVAGRKFISSYQLNGEIYMAPNHGSVVYIHELGHWLDHNSVKVRNIVYDYYKLRTKGETEQQINKIPGYENRGYGDSEVTKLDKFDYPYLGKEYYGKMTELTSMGLQYMFEDAVGFYRRDPHLFSFIFDIMTGRVLDDDYTLPDYQP